VFLRGLSLVGLAFMAVLAASPALAEVCDKVSESWSPGDPPVNALLSMGGLIHIVVLIFFVSAAKIFRSRTLAFLGFIFGLVYFYVDTYEIWQPAVIEGCMSETWPDVFARPLLWMLSCGSVFFILTKERRSNV
jgi:hypothetical protein